MKLILNLTIVMSCTVSPLAATGQNPVLLRTFDNPTPAIDDNFGSSMTALGHDRILIAARYDDTTATNAGAVYLFHTNGTLLTTFTNPNPASLTLNGDDQFGCAIATLGSDRVLIGCGQNGKAYLFTTNGSLVKTISGSPGLDNYSFGTTLIAFGTDKVLIGAPLAYFDSETYLTDGAAYLYSTNGTLLATFSNPNPEAGTSFGFSLAALGSDRVLISANEYGPGAAYLFSTNGALLTTITNPSPAAWDFFGNAVATVGTDRILIGAYGDDTQAMDSGSVYLFNTNGTLLLTITNPTPAVDDRFGARVAMLGNDRVLINSSPDDTAGTDAGAVYVFNVTGTLLATLTNPAPATGDLFGFRIAAFGSDSMLIGTPFDDAGATNAGSVYLFSFPATPTPPSLTIQRTTTNTVIVSWPATAMGFVLQQNTSGLSTQNWSNVTSMLQDDGTTKTLIVNPIGNRFYRLKHP